MRTVEEICERIAMLQKNIDELKANSEREDLDIEYRYGFCIRNIRYCKRELTILKWVLNEESK